MADTLGHSPDRSAFISSNSSAAAAILVLAFVPQIVELLWSFASIFGASGRSAPQILLGHGGALLFAGPGLLFGFGADAKGALSSDTLLALMYTYPLIAVAILTYFVRLKGSQDYFGGVVLIAVALFGLWAMSDLQGMHGFSFGAGTAPRMFGVLLLVLGVGIALLGLVFDGPSMAVYAWRGPLFVSLSILVFAVAIRPLGLVVAAFVTFLVSALGTPEIRWKETLIVGIALTVFCSFLFPYALGLPMQLWPRFLVQ